MQEVGIACENCRTEILKVVDEFYFIVPGFQVIYIANVDNFRFGLRVIYLVANLGCFLFKVSMWPIAARVLLSNRAISSAKSRSASLGMLASSCVTIPKLTFAFVRLITKFKTITKKNDAIVSL